VTELPGVRIGDPVILWGPGLTVNEVASHVGSIGYELLTRVTKRLKVNYLEKAATDHRE